MASPLSYFRKNQYLMLVGFGVLLMFAFVVAPPLQQWMDSSSRNANDPVLIKWDHGRVRQSDLDRMQYEHQVLHNFLDEVQQLTRERKGVSKVTPLRRSTRMTDLISMMLLAKKAEMEGMRVSDQAVTTYLAQLSDSVVTEQDFEELLEQNNQIARTRLFKRLKKELLAQNMQDLYESAVPVPTPADLWQAHEQLSREVSVELYPLEVADYVDQVKETPPQSELEALFEEGKTLPPDPNSDTPGFYILPKIKFQYVKAEFATFLKDAKKTVTEDDIKAEYESGIKLREYLKEQPKQKEPEPTISDPPVLNSATPTEPAEPPTEAETAPPEDEPAAADTPAAQPPLEAPEGTPAKEAPAVEGPKGDSPLLPPLEEAGAAMEVAFPQFAQFVSAPNQDEPSDNAAPPALAPADGSETPAGAPKETPAETAPQADSNAAPNSEEPATDPSQFKPLEEVREEIVLKLARGRAQEKLDEALSGVEKAVQLHYRKYIQWEAMKAAKAEDAGEEPVLNIKALASEYGLTAGETKLVNRYTVEDTELGKCSREVQSQFGESVTITFADEAFRSGKLFEPARASRGDKVDYVYWRSEEVEGKLPEFDEVEEQVTEAWSEGKAREIAKAEAEKLAARAKDDASLKATVGDANAKKVSETGSFTWLTTNMPSGMMFGARPRLTEVPGVDGTDARFMRSVFELQEGDAGVATNASQDTVYVVKMIDESSTKELREDLIADFPMMQMQIASAQGYQLLQQRMNELETEMGVTYMGQ